MTDQEIKPYLGKVVTVVIDLRRRISISIRELLYSSEEADPKSEINYWVPGNPSVVFFATDVHDIEVSEQCGVVIRLY
jgi:hypothetical protein